MNSNQKLSYAIAAILSGSAMSLNIGAARADTAADASDSEGIAEITVTAQRRTESIQNVPITIQAITGDQLKQLNVVNFEDLLRYTPNVTFSGNGPGGGNIFVRGLSSGGEPGQSQSTTAPFPNVALYLDDQSMQYPQRNNDVYLVDMERVEVLEGPQGTLFGGGAQAGVIRYITNKPKIDVTEGNVNAGYGYTAGGDDNSNVNATLNLPLIADTLAVRATIFNDRRGGYISNVAGTIAGSTPNQPIGTNAPLVADNTNPVTYTGVRFGALWKFNDDWNLLLQQNYQKMDAEGYFNDYPLDPNGKALGDYQITAFEPAYDKDKYESTAWTLNGRFGDLKAVYTGSYMVRHIDEQQDYSNYLRSGSGAAYLCSGMGTYAGSAFTPPSTKPKTCGPPLGSWRDEVKNTHQSHEIRLSTSEDYRLRGLVGGYWEEFNIYDNMNYNYLEIPQCDATNLAIALAGGRDCVSAVGPVPGHSFTDPGLRTGSDTAFGQDVKRGYRQAAAFLSIDFDIIPKVLTISGGTRYFHYDEYELGSEYGTFYISPPSAVVNVANGACVAAGGCSFPLNLSKKESGTRNRINVTWHVTSDILAYYTFSQGFRPGGFNRTGLNPDGTPALVPEIEYLKGVSSSKQYYKPLGFSSDNLINNEIGLKTEFLDHRLQVNGSAYLMHWRNVQTAIFNPTVYGNTTFNANGPNYDIRGVELQFIARVTEGLTLQGSSSWNSSKLVNGACLSSNVPASAGNPTPVGQCITQVNGAFPNDPNAKLENPLGVPGTAPPFSPPLQFNLRARYDFKIGDYKPFASIGATHIATMRNEPAGFLNGDLPQNNPPKSTTQLYTMPGYTTYDGTIGVGKDAWTVAVTGSNLTNSNASTNTSSGQFIKEEVPLRPRVVMLQFGYKF